jgi:hypothetical protein
MWEDERIYLIILIIMMRMIMWGTIIKRMMILEILIDFQ